ncbi:MAG: TonB-dependent receptor plug domain-containing protein [Acidobacteriota bacterium]
MLKLLALMLAMAGTPQETAPSSQEKEEEEQTPPGYHEVVVVTAARHEQPVGEAISMVSVLSAEDLEQTPALVLDDQLRRVPGFSLFRRSSSLVSHPTTQGVSLRGIGPSGTSRSLVLFDGIPLNDPFGGWVYWNRIPSLALEAVEISRGATSQLYGSSALGGTVQLRPRAPGPDVFELQGQVGNRESYDVSALASDQRRDWGYLLSGRVFDTDGFFIVSDEDRGAVDRPARVEFQNFLGRVEYKNFHAGANLFREERNNGTEIQENDSWLALFDGGIEGPSWQFRFHTQFQELNSTFSRVLSDRSQEFKTAEQHFPSKGFGSSFTWEPGAGLLVGADWRQVRWEEQVQNLTGFFAQSSSTLHPRVDLLVGARVDVWENQETQTSFNPRAGLLVRASPSVTLRTSAYRGFRAPTLNELYRPFRVGNIRTQANANLGEEHLWGVEGGVDFHPSRLVLLRLNGFWNQLNDPVANVTLSVTPTLILRQRQNLGSATIKGVEAEGSYRFGGDWQMRAAYLYSDAVVDETGLRLPQVPRHQGILALEYLGSVEVRVEGRLAGEQFEDDRNNLPLAGYGVVDLMGRRHLSERLDLYVAVENLFDQEYPVGRLPIERLGTPRLVHGGIRFRLSR